MREGRDSDAAGARASTSSTGNIRPTKIESASLVKSLKMNQRRIPDLGEESYRLWPVPDSASRGPSRIVRKERCKWAGQGNSGSRGVGVRAVARALPGGRVADRNRGLCASGLKDKARRQWKPNDRYIERAPDPRPGTRSDLERHIDKRASTRDRAYDSRSNSFT